MHKYAALFFFQFFFSCIACWVSGDKATNRRFMDVCCASLRLELIDLCVHTIGTDFGIPWADGVHDVWLKSHNMWQNPYSYQSHSLEFKLLLDFFWAATLELVCTVSYLLVTFATIRRKGKEPFKRTWEYWESTSMAFLNVYIGIHSLCLFSIEPYSYWTKLANFWLKTFMTTLLHVNLLLNWELEPHVMCPSLYYF